MNDSCLVNSNSVKEVIESNVSFTDTWMKSDNNKEMAMKGMINRYQSKTINGY